MAAIVKVVKYLAAMRIRRALWRLFSGDTPPRRVSIKVELVILEGIPEIQGSQV